jgi:hypothetical protein
MVPALPATCWQAPLEPLHVSIVHTRPSSVHELPAGARVSLGPVVLEPLQTSCGSQSPVDARQTVPVLPAAWTHAGAPAVPLHLSVVQRAPSSVHAVPAATTASAGQLVLAPEHTSATSHSLAFARQEVPALPAGCWQVALAPLQVSVVQTLPSSVQAVAAAFLTSAVHASFVPSHLSSRSHSAVAGRQMKLDGCFASVHVVEVPVQKSATSHAEPFAARHTTPALPAAWTQAGLASVPLHVSVVQAFPSSVQLVPTAFTTFAGQVVLAPVQVSAASHSLVAARQVVPALPAACWQRAFEPSQRSVVQTLPSSVHTELTAFVTSALHASFVPSHLSSTSHSPAAARQTKLDGRLASTQVVDDPVQVSATSHALPFAARQTAPALPAACPHDAQEPLHAAVVHAFPSSVQPTPIAFFASVGQPSFVPLQLSARSHSPAAERQMVVEGCFASVHVVEEPVQ